MPGIMIERPKMTRTMYQSLKRHIMKEREKKKQEQEQDEELARQKKERELKKKKEQEDSLTLEQTKDQISTVEKQLDQLKSDKHDLFSRLKKVLHQEDESRKRAQMKENEMVQTMQQQYPHPIFLQGAGHMNPQSKYMTVHRSQYGTTKRPRSPSPQPQASVYGAYPPSKYPITAYSTAVKQDRYPNPKSVSYTAPSTHVTYVTQSSHTFQTSQAGAAAAAAATGIYQTAPHPQPPNQSNPAAPPPTGGKYAPGQSAFTSYPSHFAAHQQQQQQQQQQQMKDHFPPGHVGYRVQLPQRAYLPPGHGNNIPLQQQLQHADKKSGFAEDKFKLQSAAAAVHNIAHLPGHQQPSIVSQQAPKGGITSGFPVRTQASSSSYQPSPSQAVSSSTHHPYAHTRYYR